MVTIECPQCHHKNPDDAEFCEQCGAELPAPVAQSANTAATQVASYGGLGEAAAPTDQLLCPKCKAPYVPGDVFCFNCGNDLRGLPGNQVAGGASSHNQATVMSAPAVAAPVAPSNNAPANSNAPVAPNNNNGGMSDEEWEKAFSNPNAAATVSSTTNQPAAVVASQPVASALQTPASQPNGFSTPPTTAANPAQAGASAPATHLTLNVSGPYGSQTLEYQGHELLMGRTDTKTRVFPDVNLDDSAASRRHAMVWLEDQEGQFYVQDLESSNGTSLNGQDIEQGSPVKLNNGDILKIGTRYSIQVHIS